jgi:hypothetical protein
VTNDIPLPDCARHLTRLRPSYGFEKQGHISNLIQQCSNYEPGNTYLARRMVETMERIEEQT